MKDSTCALAINDESYRRRRIQVSLICAVLVFAGCESADESSNTPRITRPQPVRPIIDTAPYLCDLVPERSFLDAIGTTGSLTDEWSGNLTDTGLCLAYSGQNEASLGIQWAYTDGDRVVRRQQKQYADNVLHSLPPDLGRGFASTSAARPRINYVIALFRCREKRPWLRIDFVAVVRGRDAVRDMTDLMRIAERRFGVLHKCRPGPLESA